MRSGVLKLEQLQWWQIDLKSIAQLSLDNIGLLLSQLDELGGYFVPYSVNKVNIRDLCAV